VADQPLEDLITRLDRERREADARYNDALTALDGAIRPAALGLTSTASAPRPPDPARLQDLNRGWDILRDNVAPPATDHSLKGRLRSFIWRIAGPPLEAQKQFNALTVEYLNRDIEHRRELADAVAALTAGVAQEIEGLARFESLLVQYLQTITAYVDSKDRLAGGPELRQRLALTEQRVLALKRGIETAGAGQSPQAAEGTPGSAAPPVFAGRVDSVTYVGFEDQFRGSEAEIGRRVKDYVPILAAAPGGDIVDIGCGRGELLAALKEQGVKARGVDMNAAMVELCRGRGLDVEVGDALSYLERQGDASSGGLVAVQVVEHFEPAYLMRFLEAAHHKMRPGAPLILETINPACWMAFFETYLRDLTHQRPLHPDTLRYVVESSGFSAVDVQFRSPVGEGDRLPRVKILGDAADALPRNLAQIADAINAHADKLNARLFSSMDYVVIARR
jgi:2-polyprenyl-3-methyl-5-hydroxy-6-metoxy-1,4-benzoquinol methylase